MLIDIYKGHISKTEILGRICWISELYKKNNKCFIAFYIVTNIFKNTEYHSCIAYNKKAKLIHDNAVKGTDIFISGYNKTEKFTDKNGIERKKTNIIVKNIGFLTNTKANLINEDIDIKFEITEDENKAAINIAKKVLEQEGYKIIKT